MTYKNAEDKIESAVYDTVVLAVGRKAIIDDVNVQNAGVTLHEKYVLLFYPSFLLKLKIYKYFDLNIPRRIPHNEMHLNKTFF